MIGLALALTRPRDIEGTMRRHSLFIAVAVFALVGALAWVFLAEPSQSQGVAVSDVSGDTRQTPKVEAFAAPTPEEIVLPEYVADSAGLPSTDEALQTQVPLLMSAAERGNATAACRLAEIARVCTPYQRLKGYSESAHQQLARQAEEDAMREDIARPFVVEAMPESLRAYAESRLKADSRNQRQRADFMRLWVRRCASAPVIDDAKALSLLRQAALAGEPRSLARYAQGEWLIEFWGLNAASIGIEGRGLTWMRDPAFNHWRREAPTLRRIGISRGHLDMLRAEFSIGPLTRLLPPNSTEDIDRAAALRAFAGLVSDNLPESTASLGLEPADAAEADRLSNEWMRAGRERKQPAAIKDASKADPLDVPTCD